MADVLDFIDIKSSEVIMDLHFLIDEYLRSGFGSPPGPAMEEFAKLLDTRAAKKIIAKGSNEIKYVVQGFRGLLEREVSRQKSIDEKITSYQYNDLGYHLPYEEIRNAANYHIARDEKIKNEYSGDKYRAFLSIKMSERDKLIFAILDGFIKDGFKFPEYEVSNSVLLGLSGFFPVGSSDHLMGLFCDVTNSLVVITNSGDGIEYHPNLGLPSNQDMHYTIISYEGSEINKHMPFDTFVINIILLSRGIKKMSEIDDILKEMRVKPDSIDGVQLTYAYLIYCYKTYNLEPSKEKKYMSKPQFSGSCAFYGIYHVMRYLFLRVDDTGNAFDMATESLRKERLGDYHKKFTDVSKKIILPEEKTLFDVFNHKFRFDPETVSKVHIKYYQSLKNWKPDISPPSVVLKEAAVGERSVIELIAKLNEIVKLQINPMIKIDKLIEYLVPTHISISNLVGRFRSELNFAQNSTGNENPEVIKVQTIIDLIEKNDVCLHLLEYTYFKKMMTITFVEHFDSGDEIEGYDLSKASIFASNIVRLISLLEGIDEYFYMMTGLLSIAHVNIKNIPGNQILLLSLLCFYIKKDEFYNFKQNDRDRETDTNIRSKLNEVCSYDHTVMAICGAQIDKMIDMIAGYSDYICALSTLIVQDSLYGFRYAMVSDTTISKWEEISKIAPRNKNDGTYNFHEHILKSEYFSDPQHKILRFIRSIRGHNTYMLFIMFNVFLTKIDEGIFNAMCDSDIDEFKLRLKIIKISGREKNGIIIPDDGQVICFDKIIPEEDKSNPSTKSNLHVKGKTNGTSFHNSMIDLDFNSLREFSELKIFCDGTKIPYFYNLDIPFTVKGGIPIEDDMIYVADISARYKSNDAAFFDCQVLQDYYIGFYQRFTKLNDDQYSIINMNVKKANPYLILYFICISLVNDKIHLLNLDSIREHYESISPKKFSIGDYVYSLVRHIQDPKIPFIPIISGPTYDYASVVDFFSKKDGAEKEEFSFFLTTCIQALTYYRFNRNFNNVPAKDMDSEYLKGGADSAKSFGVEDNLAVNLGVVGGQKVIFEKRGDKYYYDDHEVILDFAEYPGLELFAEWTYCIPGAFVMFKPHLGVEQYKILLVNKRSDIHPTKFNCYYKSDCPEMFYRKFEMINDSIDIIDIHYTGLALKFHDFRSINNYIYKCNMVCNADCVRRVFNQYINYYDSITTTSSNTLGLIDLNIPCMWVYDLEYVKKYPESKAEKNVDSGGANYSDQIIHDLNVEYSNRKEFAFGLENEFDTQKFNPKLLLDRDTIEPVDDPDTVPTEDSDIKAYAINFVICDTGELETARGRRSVKSIRTESAALLKRFRDETISMRMKSLGKNNANILLANAETVYRLIINNLLVKILSSIKKMPSDAECEEYLKLFDNLNRKIIYLHERPVSVMIYELFSGLLIRTTQFELIRNITQELETQNDYNVYQMLMGQGKTSFVTPIIILENMIAKKSSMLVLPKSLVPQTFSSILLTDMNSLLQNVRITNPSFYRGMKKGETLFNLSRIGKDRHVVVSDDNSVKTLFIESKSNMRLKEVISGVCKTLKSEYIFIFDEFDKMCNPITSKLTYPDDESLDSARHFLVKFATYFVKILLKYHDRSFGFTDKALSEKVCRNTLSVMVEHHLSDFEDDEKKSITAINDHLNKRPYETENHEMTNLLFSMFLTFSSCLTKFYNVQYGLQHKECSEYVSLDKNYSNYYLAIPYEAADTPVMGSRFQDINVTIIFTIISYLNNGLRDVDFIQLHKYLISRSGSSEPEFRTIIFREVELIFKMYGYENFSHDINTLETFNVDRESKLRKDENLVFYYLNNIIFENLLFTTVKSSTCSFLEISRENFCKIKTGFSGTVNIKNLFVKYKNNEENEFVDVKPDKSSIGAIKAAISGYVNPVSVITISGEATIFGLIINNNYNCLIDSGAFLRKYNSKDFIDEFIGFVRDFGISDFLSRKFVYVNKNSDRMVAHWDGQKIIHERYRNQIIPSKFLFIYYDNKHIVGIDIKQPYRMKGLVTVNTFNRITDISQAIYRLRGLNYGHTIDFLVEPELGKIVGSDNNDSLKNLINYLSENEESVVKQQRKLIKYQNLCYIKNYDRYRGDILFRNQDYVFNEHQVFGYHFGEYLAKFESKLGDTYKIPENKRLYDEIVAELKQLYKTNMIDFSTEVQQENEQQYENQQEQQMESLRMNIYGPMIFWKDDERKFFRLSDYLGLGVDDAITVKSKTNYVPTVKSKTNYVPTVKIGIGYYETLGLGCNTFRFFEKNGIYFSPMMLFLMGKNFYIGKTPNYFTVDAKFDVQARKSYSRIRSFNFYYLVRVDGTFVIITPQEYFAVVYSAEKTGSSDRFGIYDRHFDLVFGIPTKISDFTKAMLKMACIKKLSIIEQITISTYQPIQELLNISGDIGGYYGFSLEMLDKRISVCLGDENFPARVIREYGEGLYKKIVGYVIDIAKIGSEISDPQFEELAKIIYKPYLRQ